MPERTMIKWLGKEIGTADGWDGDPGDCWWTYDFVPNEHGKALGLTECKCLLFSEIKGTVRVQDNDGNDLQIFDVVWSLTARASGNV